jgi:hypothetical protein
MRIPHLSEGVTLNNDTIHLHSLPITATGLLYPSSFSFDVCWWLCRQWPKNSIDIACWTQCFALWKGFTYRIR